MLISVPHIGLVNLVLNRGLVPEHIGARSIARSCAEDLFQLWTNAEVFQTQLDGLREVKQRLDRSGSYERAADAILDFLSKLETGCAETSPAIDQISR
jgi:lipid A disaccharide synthetase